MPSPVEQIKSRLDVVDVIQSYIKLQKVGSNFKAPCPFHNEKTPSFFVSPAREVWHCFGCGKGGDLIRFVMEIEGVEFPEALQILANRAGIQLVAEDPRLRNERLRLFKLLEEAVLFYESELKKNNFIQDYLRSRGLATGTISEFRIGYAPESWDATLNYLKGRGYMDAEVEKVGLSIPSAKSIDKKFYDRFRARVMFPISDSAGRVVGFSGRISPFAQKPPAGKEEPAKYINTPQTILYDKSRVLYGFDKAKTAMRQENFCVLVEGQMDVVMSHQAGVRNAVGVSGTALTPYQLAMIKRMTGNLITAFDMDPAGGLATKRGVDLALREGMEVRVAVMPAVKDPADLVKENPELWTQAIQTSKHIIDFYIETLFAKYSADKRQLHSNIGSAVLPYVALVDSEIEKAHWVGEIAKKLGIKEEPIWAEIKKYAGETDRHYVSVGAPSVDEQAENSAKKRRELMEERLLGLAAWKGGEVKEVFERRGLDDLSEKTKTLLVSVFDGSWASGEQNKDYLNTLALEAELLYADTTKNLEQEIARILSDVSRENAKERLLVITVEMQNAEKAGDQGRLNQLAQEFNQITKKII